MTEPTLTITSQGETITWHFSGDLTVFELSTDRRAEHWMNQFPRSGRWVISGEGLVQVDTAGLAFFIECLIHACHYKISLEFTLLPKKLGPLIEAQGVSELMGRHV
jgi:ABC-type transporter Mla MlaB component